MLLCAQPPLCPEVLGVQQNDSHHSPLRPLSVRTTQQILTQGPFCSQPAREAGNQTATSLQPAHPLRSPRAPSQPRAMQGAAWRGGAGLTSTAQGGLRLSFGQKNWKGRQGESEGCLHHLQQHQSPDPRASRRRRPRTEQAGTPGLHALQSRSCPGC